MRNKHVHLIVEHLGIKTEKVSDALMQDPIPPTSTLLARLHDRSVETYSVAPKVWNLANFD